MKNEGVTANRQGRSSGRAVDDIFPKLHLTNVEFMPVAANDLCQGTQQQVSAILGSSILLLN